MNDAEKRPDFRNAFFSEAVQLRKDLAPFAEMMRRHPAIIRSIMKTEHLTFSAEEQAIMLGRKPK